MSLPLGLLDNTVCLGQEKKAGGSRVSQLMKTSATADTSRAKGKH
jgi:hypothetical protein